MCATYFTKQPAFEYMLLHNLGVFAVQTLVKTGRDSERLAVSELLS